MIIFFNAFCAFFITFIREVIKDLEDEKGDRLAGAKTIAIVCSLKRIEQFLKVLYDLYISFLCFFTIIIYS